MDDIKHIVIDGFNKKPITIDLNYRQTNLPKPIIIFCHGYKGFKDWGAWNLMADAFAQNGFFFIKFNFSHNGSTQQNPLDFSDLEAFGNNNYIKELNDLEAVINWICEHHDLKKEANINNISLMGHSRGGGIVSIKAQEDLRIKNIITIAGVSDYKSRFLKGDDLKNWEKAGVTYVLNGRTKQQMPHYYQFYTNFIKNEARLTISSAIKNLTIPHLIIHGDADTSVPLLDAYAQHEWNPNSKLVIIKDANHVFGVSHPWQHKEVSNHLKQVIQTTLDFLM